MSALPDTGSGPRSGVVVRALPADRAHLHSIVDATELMLSEIPEIPDRTIGAPELLERLPKWAHRLAPVACRLLVDEGLVDSFPANDPRSMVLRLTPRGLALMAGRRTVGAMSTAAREQA